MAHVTQPNRTYILHKPAAAESTHQEPQKTPAMRSLETAYKVYNVKPVSSLPNLDRAKEREKQLTGDIARSNYFPGLPRASKIQKLQNPASKGPGISASEQQSRDHTRAFPLIIRNPYCPTRAAILANMNPQVIQLR